jgi:ElaB/YqjD/DUF883 family membrane-anchored ribosome-binding protein
MKQQMEAATENPDIAHKAQEWQENIKEGAQKATRATTQYVEENPWKAIAIVALCALALGFLLKPSE